jgi:hypothetical protein
MTRQRADGPEGPARLCESERPPIDRTRRWASSPQNNFKRRRYSEHPGLPASLSGQRYRASKDNYRKAAGRHKSDRNQLAVAAALIVVAVAVAVVAAVVVVRVVVVASLMPKVEKCLGLAP